MEPALAQPESYLVIRVIGARRDGELFLIVDHGKRVVLPPPEPLNEHRYRQRQQWAAVPFRSRGKNDHVWVPRGLGRIIQNAGPDLRIQLVASDDVGALQLATIVIEVFASFGADPENIDFMDSVPAIHNESREPWKGDGSSTYELEALGPEDDAYEWYAQGPHWSEELMVGYQRPPLRPTGGRPAERVPTDGVEGLGPGKAPRATARRASIRLLHAEGGLPIVDGSPLTPGQLVAIGFAYGAKVPGDLVKDVPTIEDEIGPSSDKRTLDVAIYSDTSSIVAPASQELPLPSRGRTGELVFHVRLPEDGSRTRLRILVWHGEHLAQAFEVHITVGDGHPRPVDVELTYSRLTSLDDIETLAPRLLGVATNEDTTRGSHRLMFAGGQSVELTEEQSRDATDVRQRLFDEAVQAGRWLGEDLFDDLMRRAADDGRELWNEITAPVELYDDFERVRTSSGEVIQVNRLNRKYSYPWGLLYDWDLPNNVTDSFCTGDCTHDGTEPVYCARGFWGFRHVIEELFADGKRVPTASISPAVGAPAVVASIGTPDKYTAELEEQLGTRWGDRFTSLKPDDPLLDRLWKRKRPAIAVAIGHVERRAPKSERPTLRMALQPDDADYLDVERMQKVYSRIGRNLGQWRAPGRPIVMLLGCDTARSGLASLNEFAFRFTEWGASAVIATESKITAEEAAVITRVMLDCIAEHGTGEGLRRARMELLAQRNVLGLAFTLFGSADVHVPALSA
jgi:hypothetical protein